MKYNFLVENLVIVCYNLPAQVLFSKIWVGKGRS